MPDSQLNGAERPLQHSFMKSVVFNGLIMAVAIGLIALLIRAMPDRRAISPASMPLTYRPIELASAGGPLRLAGAWEMEVGDRRFGGLSSLAADNGKFLSISDRGVVVRFDPPDSVKPEVRLSDLREGPGPFGKKSSRDAESLVRDWRGRGWWIGFEQRHSLWLYDRHLQHALENVDLRRSNWRDNSGAEGLTFADGALLVLGEDGRDAFRIESSGPRPLKLHAGAEVADAARAPDGTSWVLLRQPGLSGIVQSVAPLLRTHDGWMTGTASPLPPLPFDNFEGMAIVARPDGRWRFWLVNDNDYRSVARTLLVALDLESPVSHDKSPAQGAGLSKKPPVEVP